MIRRLLCWLGDLFGKDWHKWEIVSDYLEVCRCCEEIRLYSAPCKRKIDNVEEDN